MAVIIGWYAFVIPHNKPPKAPSKPAATAEKAEGDGAGNPAELKPAEGDAAAVSQTNPEKTIHVSTPLYEASLSTTGGVLTDFDLKDYTSDDQKGRKNLVGDASVNPPLFARIRGFKPAENGDHLAYAYTGDENITLPAGAEKTIELRYGDPAVAQVVKTVTFSAKNYGLKTDYRIVTAAGVPPVKFRPVFVQGVDNSKLPQSDTARMGTHAIVSADKVKRHEFADVKKEEKKAAEEPKFVGFEDHYFLSAMLPENPKYSTLLVSNTGEHTWETSVEGPEILPGTTMESAEVSGIRLYLGPKIDTALYAVDPGLEAAINYGFAQPVVKPIAKILIGLLRFFHGFTSDWGLAILLLTILVRVVMFPLAIKQFHSMQAMALLKPKMEAIKEQYKDDKLAQNQATMELFREYKVNPLSGCLPMLPQIPIFLGLYVSLDTSLELRHAVFAGTWIHDLAIYDPYYILPIITCVTMAISMRLSPSQMDPTQQKIMMFMPLGMFFLFRKIAAGLVLYWSASNLFSIVQQLYFNKRTKALKPAGGNGAPPKVVETTATEVGGGGKKKKNLSA